VPLQQPESIYDTIPFTSGCGKKRTIAQKKDPLSASSIKINKSTFLTPAVTAMFSVTTIFKD